MPDQSVQGVEQLLGIVGDAEEPLLQIAHFDQVATALAGAVGQDLLGVDTILPENAAGAKSLARAMAAATLVAVRPPAIIKRCPAGSSAARDQSNNFPDPGLGASSRITWAPYSPARRTLASPSANAWITIGRRELSHLAVVGGSRPCS